MRIAAGIASILLVSIGLAAQTAGQAVAFEVATVKQNKDPSPNRNLRLLPGGRFSVQAMPARVLITFAHQLQQDQLVGGPGWINNDNFDVMAKLDDSVGFDPARLQAAMRTLLAERFKLEVHRDTRELPVYALRVARADGRLGAGLRPSTADCARPPTSGGPPPGGLLCGVTAGLGTIRFGGLPLGVLASTLSNVVQRTVVNRTELTGAYEFELTYAPDRTLGGPPPGVESPAIDPNGPSVFTALQEQLGLKLEPSRAPVDVIVIDRIERPSDD